MIPDAIRAVADAVLFEGYLLYPYRHSAVKNRQRWTFGGLYPEAVANHNGSASGFRSQLLVEGPDEPRLSVTVRFLHLLQRDDGREEGMTRETGIGPFEFPAADRQLPISGAVETTQERVAPTLTRVTISVRNTSPGYSRMAVMASTHAIAHVESGQFVSLTDYPEPFAEAAAQCVQSGGVWPVLAGSSGSREYMLISPIILYDYPQVAPESKGDLFDGAEIDEILSLRVLTLTDAEKTEVRSADRRARELLDRTERLSEKDWMELHGVMRNPHPAPPQFKKGDRVRLLPRKNADIMDIALRGKLAEIESVEIDYEQRVHLAVLLDDDPGRDLGALRQPGHRFFFSPEEVELAS
jgi:hydrogenase maturation protease